MIRFSAPIFMQPTLHVVREDVLKWKIFKPNLRVRSVKVTAPIEFEIYAGNSPSPAMMTAYPGWRFKFLRNGNVRHCRRAAQRLRLWIGNG